VKRFQADLLLFLVAVIWGSAFVAQRIASQEMGFFAFNSLRFLLGAMILAPFALKAAPVQNGIKSIDKTLWQTIQVLTLIAGLILFIAATLQQAGLRYTTAANAGFFTSIYVVIVPFVFRFVWKARISAFTWASAILALIGAGLLSTGGNSLRLAPGDVLEIIGSFFWALHVLVVGLAVKKINVMRFSAGQYLVAGILNLGASLIFEGNLLEGVREAWWIILYIGFFSTAIGYTLQAVGQKLAPPMDAAILLSLEAVFAALFGWIILGELLNVVQVVGCCLIFVGVIITQLKPFPDTIY
jgi:drug/metabolite transporter (DMT)-like permease